MSPVLLSRREISPEAKAAASEPPSISRAVALSTVTSYFLSRCLLGAVRACSSWPCCVRSRSPEAILSSRPTVLSPGILELNSPGRRSKHDCCPGSSREQTYPSGLCSIRCSGFTQGSGSPSSNTAAGTTFELIHSCFLPFAFRAAPFLEPDTSLSELSSKRCDFKNPLASIRLQIPRFASKRSRRTGPGSASRSSGGST
mmetsp:Transcript_9351/g.26720  ORF Transcript_9351/g.26720 Transcript_9351/m.26720 type:complete len:200 (-) Transcript_9351:450-1049(-)